MHLVDIVKALPANQHRTLYIVTPYTPEGAKAAGIARVLINEQQMWTIRLIHMDPNFTSEEIDAWLARIFNAQAQVFECEMRIHGNTLYVPRMAKVTEEKEKESLLNVQAKEATATTTASSTTSHLLEVANPGSITSLR